MDNLTWDLTIKQNPSQQKYIDSALKVDPTKQTLEEFNLKQLNIDNSPAALPNGEGKVNKEIAPIPQSSDKGDLKTKVKSTRNF